MYGKRNCMFFFFNKYKVYLRDANERLLNARRRRINENMREQVIFAPQET